MSNMNSSQQLFIIYVILQKTREEIHIQVSSSKLLYTKNTFQCKGQLNVW